MTPLPPSNIIIVYQLPFPGNKGLTCCIKEQEDLFEQKYILKEGWKLLNLSKYWRSHKFFLKFFGGVPTYGLFTLASCMHLPAFVIKEKNCRSCLFAERKGVPGVSGVRLCGRHWIRCMPLHSDSPIKVGLAVSTYLMTPYIGKEL